MQFWSLFELSRLLPNKDGAIPNALAGCILRCFLWRLYFRPGQQISTVLKWGWPDSNTLMVTSLCKVILWPYRRCVFLSPWYIYLNLWEAEVLLLPFYQKFWNWIQWLNSGWIQWFTWAPPKMWTITSNKSVIALIQGPSFLPGLEVGTGHTVFEDIHYTVRGEPKSPLTLP